MRTLLALGGAVLAAAALRAVRKIRRRA